jgi:DtxR family Mn-dependent transcriptional regulator
MPTRSTEDYLKGIYKLQKDGHAVSTSDLARHLGLEDGSVTGMLKKLAAQKFVRHQPYRGVELTASGKKLAVKMTRRHRLWEMFLVQFLGYTWDEVHAEAERLEHVTSDDLEYRLDKLLGRPKFDPHGDPIPSVDGELQEEEPPALAECEIGDRLIIVRFSDEPALLQHAAKLGLGLHTKIMVREKLAFDGSLVVAAGKRSIVLSPKFAESIFVRVA